VHQAATRRSIEHGNTEPSANTSLDNREIRISGYSLAESEDEERGRSDAAGERAESVAAVHATLDDVYFLGLDRSYLIPQDDSMAV